jgi:hypothetical protein
MWLMGNKKPMGPLVAIASEVVWLGLIIKASLWGLLPLNAALVVIQTRNFIKWTSKPKQKCLCYVARREECAECGYPEGCFYQEDAGC